MFPRYSSMDKRIGKWSKSIAKNREKENTRQKHEQKSVGETLTPEPLCPATEHMVISCEFQVLVQLHTCGITHCTPHGLCLGLALLAVCGSLCWIIHPPGIFSYLEFLLSFSLNAVTHYILRGSQQGTYNTVYNTCVASNTILKSG